jgi:hypothetical protein
MRDDMARVIVERPRIPDFNSRKGRRRPLEDLPTREGTRRSHALRGDRKELNENLTPLRLCDFVAVKPRRVTLSWYSFAGGREHADCLWRQPFYVDPVNRLLCRTDRLPVPVGWQKVLRDDHGQLRRSPGDRRNPRSGFQDRRSVRECTPSLRSGQAASRSAPDSILAPASMR